MGLIMKLYNEIKEGTLTSKDLEEIYQKEDKKSEVYTPSECPCSYGICSECSRG